MRHYKSAYQPFFLTVDASDGKYSTGDNNPGRVSDYYRFGWLLFLALREHKLGRFKDLVTCTNGLVSVVALLVIHVPAQFRKFDIHDSLQYVMTNGKANILASLCKMYETSEDELKKMLEKANNVISDNYYIEEKLLLGC